MRFPILPRRKAFAISNGFFLILLGFLFYIDQWWPNILFAIGFTVALRQYLTGRRIYFLFTIIIIALLGALSLAGYAFSLLFPLLLIAIGLILIIKECFALKGHNFLDSSDLDKE